MQVDQAAVIAQAYHEHQSARKAMKTLGQALSRDESLRDEEITSIVETYLRSGEQLDNAIETKGLLPLD